MSKDFFTRKIKS